MRFTEATARGLVVLALGMALLTCAMGLGKYTRYAIDQLDANGNIARVR